MITDCGLLLWATLYATTSERKASKSCIWHKFRIRCRSCILY